MGCTWVQRLHVGCWCQRGMMNILWHLDTDLNRALNRRALFQRPGSWCKEHLSLHAFGSLGTADGCENLTWLGSQPCLGQEVGLSWLKSFQLPLFPYGYLPDKKLFCDYFEVLWLFKEQLKCCGQILQQNIKAFACRFLCVVQNCEQTFTLQIHHNWFEIKQKH